MQLSAQFMKNPDECMYVLNHCTSTKYVCLDACHFSVYTILTGD